MFEFIDPDNPTIVGEEFRRLGLIRKILFGLVAIPMGIPNALSDYWHPDDERHAARVRRGQGVANKLMRTSGADVPMRAEDLLKERRQEWS